MMQKYFLLFLLSVILYGDDDVSGVVHSYYISRLSDGSIINLPFRVMDVKWQRDTNIMSIYSHMALEYRMPSGPNTFLETIDAKNFSWDLRELYFTWQLPDVEIRLGKQIHAWGSADANSPVDNLNAYDYYYMFSIGAEQKMGSYSLAGDYYLDDWKFGFYVSPFHHISRLPIDDPEFPMELPANPKDKQILPVEDPLEFAGDITKSFDSGDITLSYFNGYDRSFSPLGFNVWDNAANNASEVKIDTIFSYRKTEVLGLGGVAFLGDVTLRADVAYFTTKDRDVNLVEIEYRGNDLTEYFIENVYTDIRENDSEKFNAHASYYQANLQFEYTLPYDIQITGQYMAYDTLQYKDDLGFVDINLPSLEVQYTPAEYFLPGLGAGLSILTKRVLLVDIKKPIYDNTVELNLKTMMDQVHSGALVEFGVGYSISNSINSYFAITKIFGDKGQDDKYEFNHMENFSHARMELKYYF